MAPGRTPALRGAGPGFIDPAESRAQPLAGSVWERPARPQGVVVGEPGRSFDHQVVEALRRERHVPVDGLAGQDRGVRAAADLAVVDLVAFARRSTRSGRPWSGRLPRRPVLDRHGDLRVVRDALATDGVLAGCVRGGRGHGHLDPVLADAGLAERQRTRLSWGRACWAGAGTAGCATTSVFPNPAEAMIRLWEPRY
jgi:hypothetical protein